MTELRNIEDLKTHTPPTNIDAERHVIGALISHQDVYDDICEIVSAEDFYHDIHQKLFKVAEAIHAEGKKISPAMVFEVLIERKQQQDLGSPTYLVELYELDPTGANARTFAEVVRKYAERRAILFACQRAIQEIVDNRSNDDIVADLEDSLSKRRSTDKVNQLIHIRDLIAAEEERIRKARLGEVNTQAPIPTGLSEIDDCMGGIKMGVTTIGARPGVGKTAFALQMMRTAAQNGIPSLMLSLEMSPDDLLRRQISSMAKVDLNTLSIKPQCIDIDTMGKIGGAMATLNDTPMYFIDSYGINFNKFQSVARKAILKHGVKLVIIDYLQLMESSSPRESRLEFLSRLTRGLKNFQRRYNIALLQLSQFNRSANETDREPRLSDFRECGTIEQDTDNAILLWPTGEESDKTKTIGCSIAKHRNGPTPTFSFTYRKRTTSFENFSVARD